MCTIILRCQGFRFLLPRLGGLSWDDDKVGVVIFESVITPKITATGDSGDMEFLGTGQLLCVVLMR